MSQKDNDQKASLDATLGLDDIPIPSGVDRRAFLMRSAALRPNSRAARDPARISSRRGSERSSRSGSGRAPRSL